MMEYDLLWHGWELMDRIRLGYDPDDHPVFPSGLLAEKVKIIEEISSSGRIVEILPLYRCRDFSVTSGELRFTLGHTDFGEYLLTDIAHPDWKDGPLSHLMSHPLSVSMVTVTSDRRIIVGRRSGKVVEGNGCLQTIPSGFIHPPDSVDSAIVKELAEELAVNRDEIADLRMTGLIRLRHSGKPEIVAAVTLSIPSSGILERSGCDRWELDNLRTVEITRSQVWSLLTDQKDPLIGPSHAALRCFAMHEFGQGP